MRKPTDGRAARGRRATPDRVCGRRDLAGLPQWQPVVERCGRAPLPGSNHLRRRSRWNTGTPEKPTPIPAGNNQTRQGVPGDLVAASVDHTSKVLTESGGPFPRTNENPLRHHQPPQEETEACGSSACVDGRLQFVEGQYVAWRSSEPCPSSLELVKMALRYGKRRRIRGDTVPQVLDKQDLLRSAQSADLRNRIDPHCLPLSAAVER